MDEKTLSKDELIGRNVTITECKDPSWKGKSGLVLDETKNTGRYQVIWNATDDFGRKVSSGVYFYQFESEKYSATRKMIFIM